MTKEPNRKRSLPLLVNDSTTCQQEFNGLLAMSYRNFYCAKVIPVRKGKNKIKDPGLGRRKAKTGKYHATTVHLEITEKLQAKDISLLLKKCTSRYLEEFYPG